MSGAEHRGLSPDAPGNVAADFLRWLDPVGTHNLVAMHPETNSVEARTFTVQDHAEIAPWVDARAGRLNLYYTANEVRPDFGPRKPKKEDIVAIRAVFTDVDPMPFVDLDAERARIVAKLRTDAPLPFNAIIDSGGGFQALVVLTEKLPATSETVEWAESHGRGMGRALGADNVQNVDRLLRLPGPDNLPNSKKQAKGRIQRAASIVSCTDDRTTGDAISRQVVPVGPPAGDDTDADVTEAILDITHSGYDCADTYAGLSADLKARFDADLARDPALAKLWQTGAVGSDDKSGSALRFKLAGILKRLGGYDADAYASLAWVWPLAVQAGDDRAGKLTPRQLGRDWARTKAAGTGQPDLAEAFFQPERKQEQEQEQEQEQTATLPVAGALRFGERFVSTPGVGNVTHEGVRQLVEPFVRRPGAAVSREMAGATAAGVGAASANAAHDAATGGEGGTWWTDLLGGVSGLGVAALGEGLTSSVANIGRHVTNSPKHRDMIAGEAVADRLVDNSTTMQAERFAGRPLDAEVLAQRLDRPTQLEELVPEYRAGTADRSGDSGIRSLAYNTEALAPGAANTRRERNMSAVGDFIRALQPDGNAPAFLETVRDAAGNIIDTARGAAGAARSHFDEAMDRVRPRQQAIDRGQAIRDDMTTVYDQRRGEYRDAYAERDTAMSRDRIDAGAPYRALQNEARQMTTYERDAYVPADVMDSARKIAPSETPPQATGLVDMFGQPVMRPGAAPAEIPLTEALAIRQGLTTKQREALAAGRAPEHRALSQLSEALRRPIDDAMSPETRALDQRARELRRGVAADFEDGNLPSRILDETVHDRPRLATEAIAPRVTAAETPYRDTMRHVGTREGSRVAIRDQILADAQSAGALRNQDALNEFMATRAYQFDDFPEARAALEAAGTSKTQLDRAETFVKAQERRYAPGSTSPVGRFTRHDDTGVADAMRGLWKSARPREAVREVLDTAGRTPQNLKNARAAFFEDLARTTTNSAHDAAGNIVWNGRTLDGFLKNPKVGAVMDELWKGNEGHLQDLRKIGEALIDSESALRARPAASSGTASISLQGKVDPALTATSISSTLRSVQRGQMSTPIAGVHLLAGWVRGRSAKVHAAAINELMTKAMDDPKLAAELLRKHNPYDAQVMGRRFLRKFGLRVPQLANIVNEELGGYSEQDQAFDEFAGQDD